MEHRSPARKSDSAHPRPKPNRRLRFRIENAHLVPNTDEYIPMKTDAGGHFTFTATEGPLMMLVAHPRGFAIRSKDQLVAKVGSQVDVVLEPWGRIEGTLKIGEKIGANGSISIMHVATDETHENPVSQRRETRTDSQGRFAFEQVLPGSMRLWYSVNPDIGTADPNEPDTGGSRESRTNHQAGAGRKRQTCHRAPDDPRGDGGAVGNSLLGLPVPEPAATRAS